MKQILSKLYQHKLLSREEAKSILISIAREEFNPIEVASFLSIFNMRNVSIDELKGFRDGMLELCLPVNLDAYKAIDVCGTGGDGKNTFNISTLSAFVLVGAGVPVAKHGNYGVSSISGSSNVLEYLGIQFQKDDEGLKRQMDKANICFIHAPFFHPAMKSIAPIRKQLGIKTIFNMLGPLSNPSQPKFQMVGLYNLDLMRLYQYIFQDEDKQFSLVHTLSGYDEVSLTDDFRLVNNQGEYQWNKNNITDLDIKEEDLFGGDIVEEAGKIFLDILNGKGTKEQNEVVIINAGIAIQTYFPLMSLDTAKDLARMSLESGKALDHFNLLKESV